MQEYQDLISRFLTHGYQTAFFSPNLPEHEFLILRHDVDFDVSYAYELSFAEDELDIKSTFFFLLHSNSYNLIEHVNIARLKSMTSRGHKISIHFDPTKYEDVEEGFRREKELFENVFDVPVEYVSIHKPSDYFLNNRERICGVQHTYHPDYFEKIKYFSDSQGRFRYGHPCESDDFESKRTIQLLIHPIWWATEAQDPLSKLDEFLSQRNEHFEEHVANNCSAYIKPSERSQ